MSLHAIATSSGRFALATTVVLTASFHSPGRRTDAAQSRERDATRPTLTFVRQVPDTAWTEYRLPNGRTVYAIQDQQPKPTILLLQGSGCLPLFTVDYAGGFHGTSIFEDVVRTRSRPFHFVMVEKSGVAPLVFDRTMTRAAQEARFKAVEDGACTTAYFADETKTRRVGDAAAVIEALAGEPWVSRTLVLGHSEGSDVAAGLLRIDTAHRIAAAGLLTGAGLTQFFSGDETREALGRHFTELLSMRIARDDDKWQGHAARRWKTYAIDSSPLDDLRESRTPLYVAHGGRETNLHAADAFVLEALRQQPARPLRYVVVADGDHAFESSSHQGLFFGVFDDFVKWAAVPAPPTAFEVLR